MTLDKQRFLRHSGGRVISPLEVAEWPMECTHDYQAIEDIAEDRERYYLRCRKCDSSFYWSSEERNRPKSWWTAQRQAVARRFSKKPHKLIGVSSCRICDKCHDLFYGKADVHVCLPESERTKHGPDSGCEC